MAGIKAFRKIQLGREATAGTSVAATSIWRGEGTYEDQRKQPHVTEDIGIIGATSRVYLARLMAQIQFADTPLTFEGLPYILDGGIKTVAGVQDGTGSDYIYTYAFPTTSANTIKTYTIEVGDNAQEEEAEYCFVSEFNLKGEGGSDTDAATMSATWVGRQLTTSTYTGALSVATVEEAIFPKAKLYVETIGGTFGTTQLSNTFLGFDYKVKTGWHPRFVGDGNASPYFDSVQFLGDLEVTCDVRFEYDSSALAEIVKWRARTPMKMEIELAGGSVTTAGTSYSTKKIRLQMVGTWDKFTGLDDLDGGDTVTGTFRQHYHATPASQGNIIVVNENTAIT
jgi:hypothetical protein